MRQPSARSINLPFRKIHPSDVAIRQQRKEVAGSTSNFKDAGIGRNQEPIVPGQ